MSFIQLQGLGQNLTNLIFYAAGNPQMQATFTGGHAQGATDGKNLYGKIGIILTGYDTFTDFHAGKT